MDIVIKHKWVNALRSGRYTQTTSCLRDEEGYCCLGVLCDIYKEEVGGVWEDKCNGEKTFLNEEGTLPSEVVEWAGVLDHDPDVTVPDRGRDCLSSLNDSGKTFEDIADYIEESL